MVSKGFQQAAPGMKVGQAKFSALYPFTHIRPHCGPTNARLRAHLGLVVPIGGKVAIRIAEEVGLQNPKLHVLLCIFQLIFLKKLWLVPDLGGREDICN